MTDHRVYCDECEHLQKRPTKAEVPLGSGNYIVTGQRYYCVLHDKWWSVNTTEEQTGYSSCVFGMRKAGDNK